MIDKKWNNNYLIIDNCFFFSYDWITITISLQKNVKSGIINKPDEDCNKCKSGARGFLNTLWCFGAEVSWLF